MAKITKEHLSSNNILPIIVAIITACGGYFANHSITSDKIAEIEKKIAVIPNEQVIDLKISNLADKIQTYVDNQKSINILLLKHIQNENDLVLKKQVDYSLWSNYKMQVTSPKVSKFSAKK